MTEDDPVACSLGSGALGGRLAELSRFGAERCISRDRRGETHLLSFEAEGDTWRRLERIVAAERECCSFLDLRLEQGDGKIRLAIGGPPVGRSVADALAAALAGVGADEDGGQQGC